MHTVTLCAQLRPLAGGREHIKVWNNSTLRGLIDSLNYDVPGLLEKLLNQDGTLRSSVKIYVDTRDAEVIAEKQRPKQDPEKPPMPKVNAMDCILQGGEEITILPAVESVKKRTSELDHNAKDIVQ